MPRKLTITQALLNQDKAWEKVERARADLRAAIRNGLKCTNCGGKGYIPDASNFGNGDDCINCLGLGALDKPEVI